MIERFLDWVTLRDYDKAQREVTERLSRGGMSRNELMERSRRADVALRRLTDRFDAGRVYSRTTA